MIWVIGNGQLGWLIDVSNCMVLDGSIGGIHDVNFSLLKSHSADSSMFFCSLRHYGSEVPNTAHLDGRSTNCEYGCWSPWPDDLVSDRKQLAPAMH